MIVEFLIEKAFPKRKNLRILDIGCGTGEIVRALSKYGQAYGVDLSSEALQYGWFRGSDHLVQADTDDMPFKEESFDLLVILDLFEHIPNDVASARDFTRYLKKGGCMIVSSPAMPVLWSKRDVELHHYRRYKKKQMTKIVRKAGLKTERMFYRNFFFFPLVLSKYICERFSTKEPEIQYDLVVVPKIMNSILIKILQLETIILKYLDLPLGSSLVCLARKE